ncbi:hypothetical protein FZEAL_10657 [Fusarium zealandicum]|uniref:Rhodopsin domain-containing protein n=1 Tax=Fusarium zealandicum TaxID=1053134 RepID=A0A8H4TYG7_9HYPO|nr:hypothetical protein FZEAL_10657 [Fusarium zealandicum]
MSVENGVVYLIDPPPGEVRDIHQPHEAVPLITVAAVFFPLATISMAVRVYTRAALVHKLSFDDYLMILAWVLLHLCQLWNASINVLLLVRYTVQPMSTVLTVIVLNYGMGKHLWNVPFTPDLYPNFSLNNVLAAIFFCAATGLAKGSILIFYLRIFPMRTAQITVWIAFTFIIGYSAASVLVNVFACNPIQGSWAPEHVETAICINRPVFYFAQAGMGIFADIITVLIPVPWLKTLMLPKKQKIGVGILLTMGAFVCVVSVIRLQSLNVLLHDLDLTHNTVMALMWCNLELNLSIIGGSMATMKPFLRMVMPSMFGTSRGKSTNDGIYLHSTSGHTGFHQNSTRGHKLNDSVKISTKIPGYSTGSEELIFAQPSEGRSVA